MQKELTSEYKGSMFGDFFSLDNFVNDVPQDQQIDQKIREKDREINFARQISKPGLISVPNIKTDRLRSILENEFKSLHEEAEQRLLSHIERHWKDKQYSKEFIRDGLALIEDPNDLDKSACPFCGQSLSQAKTLISYYQIYFDHAYKEFREDLAQEITTFKRINTDAVILSAESVVNSWRQFLGDAYSDEIIQSFADLKIELGKSKKAFEDECNKKLNDLNYKVEFRHLETFTQKFSEFRKVSDTYNEKIQLYISTHFSNLKNL